MAEQRLNAIADRLEKAVARLESSSTRVGGGGGGANGKICMLIPINAHFNYYRKYRDC